MSALANFRILNSSERTAPYAPSPGAETKLGTPDGIRQKLPFFGKRTHLREFWLLKPLAFFQTLALFPNFRFFLSFLFFLSFSPLAPAQEALPGVDLESAAAAVSAAGIPVTPFAENAASSAEKAEEESGSNAESPSSGVEVLNDEAGKTTIILTLDASAIEKLKKNASDETPADTLEVMVLPENDSMTIQSLWEQFLGGCENVHGYCRANRQNLLCFLAGLILTWFCVLLLRWLCDHFLFGKLIKKTQNLSDDYVYRAVLPPVLAFFWIAGLFLSALPLLKDAHYPQRLILALVATDVTWLLFRLIGALDHIICLYFRGKQRVFNKLIFDTIRKTLRIFLILFATCFIGQAILGLNVSSLLAAAGIFGLAIAFAVKDTISNFLSSFMMLFDNSFQIGDRIRTGSIDGDVESVDFRSTRIRSLNGHLFSVPNAVLGTGIIENVSQRPGIRYDFELTLTYETTPEKMKRAVEIVRDLISDPRRFIQSPTRSLVTFSGFQDWSMNVKVLLWFNTQNFVDSELWKHDLNLAILERFHAEGIEFAFPTHTIQLQPIPPGSDANRS